MTRNLCRQLAWAGLLGLALLLEFPTTVDRVTGLVVHGLERASIGLRPHRRGPFCSFPVHQYEGVYVFQVILFLKGMEPG